MLVPFSLQAENKALSDELSFSFSTVDSAWHDVTGASVSVRVSGQRRVFIGLLPNGTSPSYLEYGCSSGARAQSHLQLLRDSTSLGPTQLYTYYDQAASLTRRRIVTEIGCLDLPAGGTYTYKLQVKLTEANNNFAVSGCKLIALELLF